MNGKNLTKLILIWVILVIIFLIGYKTFNKIKNYNLFSKKENIVYYCDSDLYSLSSNTCLKYIVEKRYLLGDIDLSGTVDIMDVEFIKKSIDDGKDLNQLQIKLGDINSDSIIDFDDISIIQKYFQGEYLNISNKYVCPDDYEEKNELCFKKVVKDANSKFIKKGDINQNGKLDTADLKILNSYLNNNFYLTSLEYLLADYNNDLKVDNLDLVYLKEKKLKNSMLKNKVYNYVETVDINGDLVLKVINKEKKGYKKINTVINYNILVESKRDYYFQWLNYVGDKALESSLCQKLNSDSKMLFKFSVLGNENYGQLNIYDDSKCHNFVSSYNTDVYKLKK